MINRPLTQDEITHGMSPEWDEFDLEMIDNQTNLTKIVHIDDLSWYGHSQWMWQEGNFSCDCNRGKFFFNDHDLDFPCSSIWRGTNRFKITKAVFADGSEVPIDA